MRQHSSHTVVIDAAKSRGSYLRELIQHGELLYFFFWRDFLVRYKQAFFGVAWALIRPLLNMLAFAFFFGNIAHLPSYGISYPLFVLSAMLPWYLFANVINETCLCLINNSMLLTKVYFPRMILPLSQVVLQIVEFGINFVLFISVAVFCGCLHYSTLVALLYFFPLLLLFCIGVSLWISALTVKYRDVRFVVPFIVQFGMFISPVGYGSFVIPQKWAWLFHLNPLAGIIDGFRYAFFGVTHSQMMSSLTLSLSIIVLIFISGYFFFRHLEKTFADKI